MAKLPRTFEELVDGLPDVHVGGLASSDSPPASNVAVRAAETLVGSLPGGRARVARVAAKLDRLVALSRPAAQPRKRTRNG
jgi:hypothetical protein